jgi:hypothetical protein
MKIFSILLIIISETALSSTFTWELELLNKVSRETKTFILNDSKLKVTVPGKANCSVSELETTKEPDGATVESRQITCQVGDVGVYTSALCMVHTNGYKSEKNIKSFSFFERNSEFMLILSCAK